MITTFLRWGRTFLYNRAYFSGSVSGYRDSKLGIMPDPPLPRGNDILARGFRDGWRDAVVEEVQLHIADHYDELGEERFQKYAVEMEGQGAAGATEQANANLLNETPASGSLSAPPATSLDYDRRDTTQRAQQDMALAQ